MSSRVVKFLQVVEIVQHEMRINKQRWKEGKISLEELQRTHRVLDNIIAMSQINVIEKE